MTKEEELKQLAELEELDRLEKMAQQEAEVIGEAEHLDGIQQASITMSDNQPMPTPESAEKLKAFGDGLVYGVPFAKDVMAGGKAIKDEIQSQGVSSSVDGIGKRYHENMATLNAELKKSDDKYPGYYTSGQIASGAAIISLVPPLGGTLLGVGSLGAAYGLSNSENRTAMDALSGAGSAIVFDRLGVFAGTTLQKVAGKVAGFADETFKAAVGAINKSRMKELNTHLMHSRQTAAQFADSMSSMFVENGSEMTGIVREPLMMANQTFEETLSKIQQVKAQKGDELGSILTSLDRHFGKEAAFGAADLHDEIGAKIIDPLLGSDNPSTQQLGARMQSYIQKMFMKRKIIEEVTDKGPMQKIEWEYKNDFSMQKLHTLAKDISSFVRQEYSKLPGTGSNSSMLAQQKRVDGTIRSMIEDRVGVLTDPAASGEIRDSLNMFQRAKRDYGNLSISEDLLTKATAEKQEGFFGVLKNTLGIRGLMVGGTASVSGLDPASSFAVAATINQFLNSQSAPATISVGLRRLAQGLEKAPDPEVLSKVLVATSLGMDDFRDAIAYGIAKYDMLGKPVMRNIEDVKHRGSTIYSMLRGQDENLAQKFAAVLDQGSDEEIASFMSHLEENSKAASKYIEPGLGWNGKIWTENQKANATQQILEANLPLEQEIRLKNEVKAGNIPDLTPIKRSAPQWKSRDRLHPSY